MSRRFAALSALCIPAAAAGLLIAAFTDKETGFFALRGAGALLPALLPLLMAAAAVCVKRSFAAEPLHNTLRPGFAARIIFLAAAVLITAEALNGLRSASLPISPRAILSAAAQIFGILGAVWLAVAAVGLYADGNSLVGALWNSIPVLSSMLRLLQRFFSAPTNPRDLVSVAPLLTLCAACVVWLRFLQHSVLQTEKSRGALCGAALAALWFAAALSLPALTVGAALLPTLCDSLLCLCGWFFAVFCNVSPSPSTKFDNSFTADEL